MVYSLAQLKAGVKALDTARNTFDCTAPRTDVDGNLGFRSGDTTVPYGRHGSAFIGVDLETLEVSCLACSGELNATASPKKTITVKGRSHLVSA